MIHEPMMRPRVNGSMPVPANDGADRGPAGPTDRADRRYLRASRVVERRSFAAVVQYLMLALAGAADFAAFYDVLANHTNLPDAMLYLLVAGFTAMSLWLAHLVGTGYRDRVDGAPDHRPLQLWSAAIAWFGLGAAAVAVRVIFAGPAPSSFGATPSVGAPPGGDGLALAVVFGFLYLAAGVAAARGGFALHNSIELAVVAASRRIRRLQRRLGRHEQVHERVAAELRRLEAERVRIDLAHEAARLGRIALGDELKQHVRMRIAQRLNEASATDAMFEPDRYPFAASPLRGVSADAVPAPRPGGSAGAVPTPGVSASAVPAPRPGGSTGAVPAPRPEKGLA